MVYRSQANNLSSHVQVSSLGCSEELWLSFRLSCFPQQQVSTLPSFSTMSLLAWRISPRMALVRVMLRREAKLGLTYGLVPCLKLGLRLNLISLRLGHKLRLRRLGLRLRLRLRPGFGLGLRLRLGLGVKTYS